jgi:hypothetical protein
MATAQGTVENGAHAALTLHGQGEWTATRQGPTRSTARMPGS